MRRRWYEGRASWHGDAGLRRPLSTEMGVVRGDRAEADGGVAVVVGAVVAVVPVLDATPLLELLLLLLLLLLEARLVCANAIA